MTMISVQHNPLQEKEISSSEDWELPISRMEVYGADQKQLFTDITQTDLQYNQSIDILATGGYQFNNKHKITASFNIIIPNSMVTEACFWVKI
jgi:hypothetical protein